MIPTRTTLQRLLMNVLIMHIIVCFCHASFASDSAFSYVCLFYCAFYVIGQYLVRTYVKNFLSYILLHLILIVPSLGFIYFSETTAVIMVLLAVATTILSFRKSIIYRKKGLPTDDTVWPGTILLFPFFMALGKYYGYPVYAKFVFVEAIIYFILFIGYTLYTNESHFIRDHVATMNIPTSRIKKHTKQIRIIFSCLVILIMLLINVLNIALPKLGFKLDIGGYSEGTPTQTDPIGSGFNPSVLVEEEPSMLAIMLGYIAMFIMGILIVIVLIIVVILLIKELYGSLGGPAGKKPVYIEEDEIIVESISPFSSKKSAKKFPTTNAEKIRRLYRDYVLKKLNKSDRSLAKLILSPKTPKEIDSLIAKDSSEISSEIRDLYEEVRYSNREPDNEAVSKMKKHVSFK